MALKVVLMMMIITIDNHVTITVRITTRVGSYDLCVLRLKPWEDGPRPPPLLFAPDTAAWPSHEIAVIRWPCFFPAKSDSLQVMSE